MKMSRFGDANTLLDPTMNKRKHKSLEENHQFDDVDGRRIVCFVVFK